MDHYSKWLKNNGVKMTGEQLTFQKHMDNMSFLTAEQENKRYDIDDLKQELAKIHLLVKMVMKKDINSDLHAREIYNKTEQFYNEIGV